MGYQIFYLENDTLNKAVIFWDDYIEGNSYEIKFHGVLKTKVKRQQKKLFQVRNKGEMKNPMIMKSMMTNLVLTTSPKPKDILKF